MFRCNGICSNCRACGNILNMDILTDFNLPTNFQIESRPALGISVDIGTTTIAMALYNLETGELLKKGSSPNPQRNFGGDVVSRTAFAMKSKDNYDILRTSLIHTINALIYDFFKTEDEPNELKIDGKSLEKIVLCGNRVMTTILLDLPIDTIVGYPFKPYYLDAQSMEWDICIKKDNDIENIGTIDAYVVACAGGNIGGDIVAGILGADLENCYNTTIFLDLGTNGECIVKKGEKYSAFSTATGPALEGGNIKNGVFAQKGAIYDCKIDKGNIRLSIIGDEAKPIGICGSGLIFLVDALLREKLVKKDGTLESYDYVSRLRPYDDIVNKIADSQFILCTKEKDGVDIVLTQKDIREFQLAKGAIQSGINICMTKENISQEEVENLYLSGGFGKLITKEALCNTGILPRELQGDMKFLGNTAIAGASMILLNDEYKRLSEKIAKEINVIELSNEDEFQKEFLSAMSF